MPSLSELALATGPFNVTGNRRQFGESNLRQLNPDGAFQQGEIFNPSLGFNTEFLSSLPEIPSTIAGLMNSGQATTSFSGQSLPAAYTGGDPFAEIQSRLRPANMPVAQTFSNKPAPLSNAMPAQPSFSPSQNMGGGIGSLLQPIQAHLIERYNEAQVVPLLNNFERQLAQLGSPQGGYAGGFSF